MEGWFGPGGMLSIPPMPFSDAAKRQEGLERELGPKWRQRQKDAQYEAAGEMALGGLVPGMSGSGPSGFGGATTNHAGILSEIYEGILEFESGINAEIQEVSKITGNFTDKSQQEINNVGSNFLNVVDRSLAATGENIGQLTNIAHNVTKTLTDTITVNQVKTFDAMVNSRVEIDGIVDEVTQLRKDAEASKTAILERQINFRKAAAMWMDTGDDETAGLSSEQLRNIDVQLQERIITQDAVEEQQRLKVERLRREKEAADLLIKQQEEAANAQKLKDKAEALAAAKAEEFRINTLTASPMFQSFAKMKNKLKSLQNRLASQESATAGYYAAAQAARDGMNAYAYSDKEADRYLISRRKQQYWSSVVMPAQDTAQRHIETISQTRQDIRNVEHWIATKQIPAVYSNIYGRIYENQANISPHQRSNLNFDAGGIVPGDIGEPQLIMAQGGEQISPIGMPKNGGGGNTSNRVLNISIQTKSSVKEILLDLANLKTLDNASLFNSVW